MEPIITYRADPISEVTCQPCSDKNYYNPRENTSTAKYYKCEIRKRNICTEEYHKKQCGPVSWEDSKDSDGYCRCDARRSYAPEYKKEMCFTEDRDCHFTSCDSVNGTREERLLSKTVLLYCSQYLSNSQWRSYHCLQNLWNKLFDFIFWCFALLVNKFNNFRTKLS